ncbi:sigma-70 family RNA polymerase sigma factor [Janibacter terrae]|uniref:Sigma-70 family RNA polymerase sigma factor n=1 Tax=Janibacter terrae TaxID=103817 RepID=A0ABZ2FKF9_9MICO
MTGDPLQAATSEDLMRRLVEGDEDALAEAYQRFGALVHTIAVRSVGEHHEAEDITQQVFVALWKARSSLTPGAGSLGGWLATVTRRRCADHHAARARRTRDEQAFTREGGLPVSPPADVAEQVYLADVLESLGDPRATIIRMAVIEDRRQEDIAAALQLPLGTVKSHVRRGLLHLRKHLEEVSP